MSKKRFYNNKDIFLITEEAFNKENKYRHPFDTYTLFIICISRKKSKKSNKHYYYYIMNIIYGHNDREQLLYGEWKVYNDPKYLYKKQLKITHNKLRKYINMNIIKKAVYSDIAELLLLQNNNEVTEVIK